MSAQLRPSDYREAMRFDPKPKAKWTIGARVRVCVGDFVADCAMSRNGGFTLGPVFANGAF
jgi:hypothetical protein